MVKWGESIPGLVMNRGPLEIIKTYNKTKLQRRGSQSCLPNSFVTDAPEGFPLAEVVSAHGQSRAPTAILSMSI